jgi:hypothetical protein
MNGKPLSIALAGAVFGLVACTGNVDMPPTDTGGVPGQAPERSFAQFSDIPVPQGVSMDIERSLVFGGREDWIGRLVLNSSRGTGEIFDFYKQNAPQLGWQEITLVRSGTSVLTFSRGERVMTVQITNKTLRGSEIHLTVSPRGKQVMDASVSVDNLPKTRN